MNLTTEEIAIANKDPLSLKYSDSLIITSALKKLSASTSTNISLISSYSVLYTLATNKARIPYAEKAKNWENSALLNKEAGKPCGLLYEQSATLYGRDMNHSNSALLFEKAIEFSLDENIDQRKMYKLYRDSRTQHTLSGNNDAASRLFIMEKNYELAHSKYPKKATLNLYRLLSKYGEAPSRVALSSLFVIFFCAVIYSIFGIYSSSEESVIYSLSSTLYYSVVTFTTLGYGDFSPANGITRLTSSIEAICGLLLTSLFLVTIVRKYSR